MKTMTYTYSDGQSVKWFNEYSGKWYLPKTGYEIIRMKADNGKWLWYCYANGVLFDCSETLKNAMGFCQ